MHVLVTGANGFLGRYVVRALVQRGHRVRALVRSSRNCTFAPSEAVEVMVGDLRERDLLAIVAGVDAVVHLAAAVTGDDDTQFTNTVVATENLLEALRHAQIE